MHNEKGATLVEVLAALVLSSLIIGVLFLMMSSIQLEWKQSTIRFEEDTDINTTMQTLSHYLSDAIRLDVQKEQHQFTIKLESGKTVTFVYDAPRLILKDDQQEIEIANNVAQFPQFTNNKGEEITLSIGDGAQLTVTVHFFVHRINVYGTKQESVKPMELTIKLRKDYSNI